MGSEGKRVVEEGSSGLAGFKTPDPFQILQLEVILNQTQSPSGIWGRPPDPQPVSSSGEAFIRL
jgi:hypothetical protein